MNARSTPHIDYTLNYALRHLSACSKVAVTYHEPLGDAVIHGVAGRGALHERIRFVLTAEDLMLLITLAVRPTAATRRL